MLTACRIKTFTCSATWQVGFNNHFEQSTRSLVNIDVISIANEVASGNNLQ